MFYAKQEYYEIGEVIANKFKRVCDLSKNVKLLHSKPGNYASQDEELYNALLVSIKLCLY